MICRFRSVQRLTPLVLAFTNACGSSGAGADDTSGAAGSASEAGAGSGASAGQLLVPSQCILNELGPPVPRVERLDAQPIQVMCTGTAETPVLRIADDSGQGFDWQADVQPSAVFAPMQSSGSACPGFGFSDVGVSAHFADDAVPGQTTNGTLSVSTSYKASGVIEASVSATLVKTVFSLEPALVDFGTLPAGQSATAQVTVHNLGSAPIELLYPTAATMAPYLYRDWGYQGEDAPPPDPIPPDGSKVFSVSFAPHTVGDFPLVLELSPFRTSVPTACGTSQSLELRGTAIAP